MSQQGKIEAVFEFEDGSITIHSANTKRVTKTFDPGFYYAIQDQQGKLYINRSEFKEVHVPFPNQNSKVILEGISKFLENNNRKTCKELGYLYKMNVLMHGVQGSGKTALMNYLCDELIKEHDAIIFRVDGPFNLETSWSLGEKIRDIQDNLIVFIMDEFDMYCSKKGEAYMKQILDGNRSIDYSIVLGATNYLNDIPETIRDRPSRFLMVAEIKPISDKEIITDLVTKIHDKASTPFMSEEDISEMVDDLLEKNSKQEGVTVDGIKNEMLQRLMQLSINLEVSSGIGFSSKKSSMEQIKSIEDQIESLKRRVEGQPTDAFFSAYEEDKEKREYMFKEMDAEVKDKEIKWLDPEAPDHYDSYPPEIENC